MDKFTEHTLGSRTSTDPSDPTIYPAESFEESICPHGIPGSGDCVMCTEEDAEKAERAKQEEAARKEREQEL